MTTTVSLSNSGLTALKDAHASFFEQYPGGFQHPDLVDIGKKHNVDKLAGHLHDELGKPSFSNPDHVVQEMARIVSRSSMVSLFEKPKFRDMTLEATDQQKQQLSHAVYEQFYGDQEAGFNRLVDALAEFKLAKWTLSSVFLSYFDLQNEVFVKPSTAKLIVEKLDLPLTYKPRPTWEFYQQFRSYIHALKENSDPSLAPNMPAFCGFLMMSLQ